jgi:hypothetical protein
VLAAGNASKKNQLVARESRRARCLQAGGAKTKRGPVKKIGKSNWRREQDRSPDRQIGERKRQTRLETESGGSQLKPVSWLATTEKRVREQHMKNRAGNKDAWQWISRTNESSGILLKDRKIGGKNWALALRREIWARWATKTNQRWRTWWENETGQSKTGDGKNESEIAQKQATTSTVNTRANTSRTNRIQ